MKTVVITGCTNGIGKELTYLLNKEKCHLVLIGRNKKLLLELKEELIKENSQNKVSLYIADFTKITESESVVDIIKEEHPVIDVIIHNAGALPNKKGVLVDNNIPFSLIVNYYTPRMINEKLLPSLLKSEYPVVFHTTSLTIRKTMPQDIQMMNTFKRIKSYAIGKTCFYLYLQNLAKSESKITMKMFDPRIVYTNAVKNMMPKGFKWLSFLARIISRTKKDVAKKAYHVLQINEKGFNFYKLNKLTNFNLGQTPEEVDDLFAYLASNYKKI